MFFNFLVFASALTNSIDSKEIEEPLVQEEGFLDMEIAQDNSSAGDEVGVGEFLFGEDDEKESLEN